LCSSCSIFSVIFQFGHKITTFFLYLQGLGIIFNKKNEGLQPQTLKITHFLLKNPPFLEADSTTRAYISASAALRANVRIDGIVFAFRDCAHRAFVNTSTASNAVG
jgi:hypothetical protein